MYTIDTSSLITLKTTYPKEVFSKLWQDIENLIRSDKLKAIYAVKRELDDVTDDKELSLLSNIDKFIAPITDEVQSIIRTRISKDIKYFSNPDSYISKADTFVVAHAIECGLSVITDEKPTNNLNGPNIPDICKKYGVKYLQLVRLLIDQGWKY